MKRLIQRILCVFGLHKKGYPHGLYNQFGSGYRVEYYTCDCCRKEIHWSVKVDY